MVTLPQKSAPSPLPRQEDAWTIKHTITVDISHNTNNSILSGMQILGYMKALASNISKQIEETYENPKAV
jgi:hypothetical protein